MKWVIHISVCMCLGAGMSAQSIELFGARGTYLYQVDQTSGEGTPLGSLAKVSSDLANESGGSGLWGIGDFGEPTLHSIDPITQSVLSEVPIDAPEWLRTLAIDPINQTFYASPQYASDTDGGGLYRINPITGGTTLIGGLTTSISALAFDLNGNLFGAYGSSLYEIDPGTAVVTTITDELDLSRIEDLAFDPRDNAMYGVGYGYNAVLERMEYNLYQIDPGTGDTSLVGDSFIRPTGLAFYQSADSVLAGDYNGDGFVSQADLDLVLLNWGDSVIPPQWVATDQFDGVQVSQNELDEVLLNWGDGTPPGSSVAAVPEPGAGLLLGGLAWGLGLGRRRA